MSGRTAQVIVPVADLTRGPGGPRERQLLFGEIVRTGPAGDGHTPVEAEKDGYRGHVPTGALGPVRPATHWVSAPATHVYAGADLKTPDLMSLSLGSRVRVVSRQGAFAQTPGGFVPRVHLTRLGTFLSDPPGVAALFLGTPYLWGGNSRFGLDCSGLVQAAMLACGHSCPGDSGQQEQALGQALPPGTPPQRGDLLFWKGHVAMVSGPDMLLHANAHHMMVVHESPGAALERIAAQGGGGVTSHRRPRGKPRAKPVSA